MVFLRMHKREIVIVIQSITCVNGNITKLLAWPGEVFGMKRGVASSFSYGIDKKLLFLVVLSGYPS